MKKLFIILLFLSFKADATANRCDFFSETVNIVRHAHVQCGIDPTTVNRLEVFIESQCGSINYNTNTSLFDDQYRSDPLNTCIIIMQMNRDIDKILNELKK